MTSVQGVSHVTLTVADPERSADFYNGVLGTATVTSMTDDIGAFTLVAGPSLAIGLRRHTGSKADDHFDPSRKGLDHLAFRVASREELALWRDILDSHGVAHSGVVESLFGLHLNFKDPDGIALELFVAAEG